MRRYNKRVIAKVHENIRGGKKYRNFLVVDSNFCCFLFIFRSSVCWWVSQWAGVWLFVYFSLDFPHSNFISWFIDIWTFPRLQFSNIFRAVNFRMIFKTQMVNYDHSSSYLPPDETTIKSSVLDWPQKTLWNDKRFQISIM